ncbi:MAG: YvcK family protein [Coriobacteriales bacterium]|jgi:uncharacterized cofD-like protein|nr:YvcK family protein [Coriobacteriales bacterium]
MPGDQSLPPTGAAHASALSDTLQAVVIGGGTGAPVSIRALLALGVHTSAVVAMADDGGSTGLLREHAGVAAPGDIRKCLAAMAAKPDGAWARAFRQRFSYVNDHTLGNLMLTALTDATGSFPEAVKLCGELLGARGRVYPSTLENVQLIGVTRDGQHLCGQATICASDTALARVSLVPERPEAYRPALDALRVADLIVLGPGSLFTSIIPNLLVPGVLDAIRENSGTRVFLCSLADMQGETWGLSAAELVEALIDHGMADLLDVVVVHEPPTHHHTGNATASFEAITGETIGSVAARATRTSPIRQVVFNEVLARRIEAHGPALIRRNLVDPLRPTWHDVGILSEVLEGIMDACPSLRKSKTNSRG